MKAWPPIAIVAARAAPGFALALKPTLPPPVPLATDVSWSHPALLPAVQGQALPVATVRLPVAPAAATDWLAGASVKPHAAWLTVKVAPAIVSVPVLVVPRLLGVALNPTPPIPVPVAPDVTVSHGVSLLAAVHAHPAPAATVTWPVPPSAETEALVETSEYEQPFAAD